jgi:hypothetical protein
MKWADLRDLFKKASKRVCTSTIVYPEPLLPTLSTSSAMESPGNTEEDSDDLEPTAEGAIQVEYSFD